MADNVLAALALSRADVKHPDDWRSVLAPLLSAAGVKSWPTFVKGTKSIEVEAAADSSMKLIPTRNLGATDGFEPVVEKTIAVTADRDALSTAIETALELSV